MRGGQVRRILGRRRGFTLVELLVTVTIITMLAGMALGVLYASREQARIARTRATIAKINRLLMERYESYRTRRVPINTLGMPPREAAERRLNAIRDMMRMEMPQCWNDIIQGPVVFTPARPPSPWSVPAPSVYRAYQARINLNPPAPDEPNQSAECLYLILTTGPESAREEFSDLEIGDTDGDGFPEFIDGWGNPIRFLRWAPGIVDSDIQPVVVTAWSEGSFAFDSSLAVEAVKNDYDPFDSRKVDYSVDTGPAGNFPPRSWRLVPFVYSAGPDGAYDLYDVDELAASNPTAPELNYSGNPFYFLSGNQRIVNVLGRPLDGRTGWLDNIHNHRLEGR